MDNTGNPSIIEKIDNEKLLRNGHMIVPEEIMTNPLLAISKLVEKNNLAKNL